MTASRRRFCAAVAMAVACAAVPLGGAAAGAEGGEAPAEAPRFLIVSRARVLEESEAARKLAEAEAAATAALQADVDAVKAELAAEEEELTRLRMTLPPAEFEARVEVFDQRMREERRRAQALALRLQNAYRDARRRLVDELDPILEEVRTEMRALAILNSEAALVTDPSIDVTARVIELYNERISAPVVEMPLEPDPRGGGAEAAEPDVQFPADPAAEDQE